MALPRITIPRLTDHGSEISLLGIVAVGVMVLMGRAQHDAKVAFDPSAYLVVLTLIVGAIKERWTQRSVDRMGQNLAASNPGDTGPTGEANDPVNVKDVKK